MNITEFLDIDLPLGGPELIPMFSSDGETHRISFANLLAEIEAGEIFALSDHNHTGTYQPVDATLTAFGALSIAANKLPYGNGDDTFALADLTAFARNLLDDADAAVARATLAAVGTGGGDTILASGAAVIPLTLKAAASQSGRLFKVLLNNDTEIFYLTSGGAMIANGGVQIGGTLDPVTSIGPGDGFRRPLLILGATSQSAHLTEWRGVGSTPLYMSVSENGYLKVLKTSVISDAELDASEFALYWDPATYTIKGRGKNASGTAAAAFFELPSPITSNDIRITLSSGSFRFGGGTVISQEDTGDTMRLLSQINKLHIKATANAATSTVLDTLLYGAESSGTPAAGFGAGMLFRLKSSTTNDQNAARVSALWNVATHASAVADVLVQAFWNNSGTFTASEILRGRAGSNPLIGFLGATPAARQTHIADPSGGGTIDAEARTAINAILDALENFGFVATS